MSPSPVPEPSPSVDRRSGLSYDEFVSEYLLPQKPVILTDALEAWPALKKWTPEFFKTNFGDKVVTVDKQLGPKARTMKLGEYIDLVLASSPDNPCPYLSGLFVRQQFPEIAADILPELKYTLPDRLRSRLMVGPNRAPRKGIPELLISGLGGRFRLHYDAQHMLGFVTQIYGDKEWIVFEPEDGKYLYQIDTNPTFSAVDNIFAPNLERFPLVAQATPMKFVLRAGETVFNPAGWWHATRMLSPSIAMVISTVNGSNWRAFVDDVSRPRQGVPRVAAWALRGYLHAAGIALSAMEMISNSPLL